MKLFKFLWKTLVKYRAAKVGQDLRVNGFSIVSKTTILGNNVNFNGIRIRGGVEQFRSAIIFIQVKIV